jgi:steroid 5-alpha reductase family enzyme
MFTEKRVVENGRYTLGLVLEIHKFTWTPVTLFFTLLYNNYSQRMMLMNSLFGGYGMLWVLKSNYFYDKNFYMNTQHEHDIKGALLCYLSVSVYYLFPYLAATNNNEISIYETYLSTLLYTIGLFLHYGSDSQKYYTMKYNPNKLITEGLYSIVRHPNYSGEFLMWFGLILIAGKEQILSYVPLLWLCLATILSGMPEKEKSLKKYDEYQNWKENTKALIPFVY